VINGRFSYFNFGTQQKVASALLATGIFACLGEITTLAAGRPLELGLTNSILIGIAVGLFEEFYVHPVQERIVFLFLDINGSTALGEGRAVERDSRQQTRHDALTAELQAAGARENAWLREKSDLLQRQEMLAQEFEHRLVNSLQIIGSLLSLQSRTASPEAAAQLTVAALRVASFGRVHRRLHLLDHQESVEFKQYLEQLCEDLSELLFQGKIDCTIVVEAAKIDVPTVFAIPLGFIVNELITNSAKYAKSNITVRLETTLTVGHSLSVLDDGPGLPEGFDPTQSKGLGMKIIAKLVKQISESCKSRPAKTATEPALR
jgi:two-component sensor histidine kinase